jgi:hypothetical protein
MRDVWLTAFFVRNLAKPTDIYSYSMHQNENARGITENSAHDAPLPVPRRLHKRSCKTCSDSDRSRVEQLPQLLDL